MPRILYLLNISNPDKLSSDSGWLFADLLATALIDQGADVVIAAPAAVTDPRARFERTPVPATKYRARFEPDMDRLVSLIQRTRPDVVVANQIENAPAVRAALLEAKSEALLAGYCHYLPFSFTLTGQLRPDPAMDDASLAHPVRLAFVAGLAACDRVLVHSATAASSVACAGTRSGVEISERLRVVPAPRDGRLVCSEEEITAPVPGEAITGLYNHRLYAHYGTTRFLRLADRLTSEAEVKVGLRVMDLFGSRSPERRALDDSPERLRDELAALNGVEILSDRGNRDTYRQVLASSHFALAPFRPGCPWAMSVVDAQAMGLPVIAPRWGWFAEHIDEELLFETNSEAVGLVERLATDPEFYLDHAKWAQETTKDFRVSLVAARYLEAVE